jgi:MFS family permease
MDIGNETDRPGGPGWAVTALAFAMLLSSMGISIANVALPALAAAFDAPFRDVQWVVLAYLLAVTTMVVGSRCSRWARSSVPWFRRCRRSSRRGHFKAVARRR